MINLKEEEKEERKVMRVQRYRQDQVDSVLNAFYDDEKYMKFADYCDDHATRYKEIFDFYDLYANDRCDLNSLVCVYADLFEDFQFSDDDEAILKWFSVMNKFLYERYIYENDTYPAETAGLNRDGVFTNYIESFVHLDGKNSVLCFLFIPIRLNNNKNKDRFRYKIAADDVITRFDLNSIFNQSVSYLNRRFAYRRKE